MNFNDKEYWHKYYKKNYSPYKESDFAKFVLQFLEKEKYLLELGCGNGRDSIFFSKNLINVLAVDQVSDEINFLNSNFSNERIKFICDDFTNLEVLDNFDYIYSRFTIHSITESEEDRVLKWVFKHLYKNGLFFIESRSINDIMYNNGTKLSINENFTDQQLLSAAHRRYRASCARYCGVACGNGARTGSVLFQPRKGQCRRGRRRRARHSRGLLCQSRIAVSFLFVRKTVEKDLPFLCARRRHFSLSESVRRKIPAQTAQKA